MSAEADLAQAQADAAQLREEQEADLDRLQEAGLAIEELRTQVAQLRERVRELEERVKEAERIVEFELGGCTGDPGTILSPDAWGEREACADALTGIRVALTTQEQGEGKSEVEVRKAEGQD